MEQRIVIGGDILIFSVTKPGHNSEILTQNNSRRELSFIIGGLSYLVEGLKLRKLLQLLLIYF